MGWNKPTGAAPAAPKKKPNVFRGLLAGLVVVALAAIAYFTFLGGNATAPEAKAEKKPAAIKEADFVRPASNVVETGKVEKGDAANAPEIWNGHEIVSKTAETNGIYVVITMQGKDGKTYRHIKKTRRPTFDNPVDQVLAMALSTPPGGTIPPLPPLGRRADELFAAALKKPIEIKDDDPDDVKRAKLLVQAGRESILEEMCKGRSVNEIIAEHCAMVNDNAKLRSEAFSAYKKMLDEGDAEGAEAYRVQANKILEKSGSAEISRFGTRKRNRKGQEQ